MICDANGGLKNGGIMLGHHLFGLYEKALNPKYNWTERLYKAREYGFDFVEISIDEKDERIARLDWSDEELWDLRKAMVETGMPIKTMCLSAHRRFPFGSEDEKKVERAYEVMEKAIRFACNTGIRVIQLAGYDVYYEESTPKSVEMFNKGMLWAAKQAEKHQVMLGMEIMDTSFMNSITKHIELQRKINSPWYKVYPDMGNLSAWDNDVMHEWEIGVGSIVGVHVKETIKVTKDNPGKFKCVPFGTGCVDFAACFRKLEKIGYTGPYMMEMWYEDGTEEAKTIIDSRHYIEEKYVEGTSL